MSCFDTCYYFVCIERELGDPLKTFLEMRLYAQWIFRLRQNFKQLVIGQEEKSKMEYRFLVDLYSTMFLICKLLQLTV